jgi:1,2-diacylglycerol 3-alpha-glucosyltransferase
LRKVVVIFARFGPYHLARLEGAGKVLERKGIETVGIEVAGTDDTYKWERISGGNHFRRVTLFESESYHKIPGRRIRSAVWQILDAKSPDAVALPGWVYKEALAGLDWCKRNRKIAILMSESSYHDTQRWWWREWRKSRIVRQFDAALVGGKTQKSYVIKLGVPSQRIYLGYDVVDNNYFKARAEEVRHREDDVRQALKLPRRFFLASSRFVKKKNLHWLIRAYAAYHKRAQKKNSVHEKISNIHETLCHLVLCGDGPMREELENLACQLRIEDYVHFPGFIQYPQLPAFYGLATVFMHASVSEQWGLVVNEAMASGLPVLVSEACGCAPDLVSNGVNGFTFDPRDCQEMADLMYTMAHGGVDLRAMGQQSAAMISKWSPELFGEALWLAASAQTP